MTTPGPRLSMPRSSCAIAMKDYTFIRPGIAVIISAATLVVALIFGLDLIASLRHAALLLALTIFAAGMLVVPMAWLYIRYKRGATIELKV